MKHILTNIVTLGNKEIPQGTELVLRKGDIPGAVQVSIRLPGRNNFSSLGNIAIEKGVVSLPTKLIFISYAKEDRAKVEVIADKLE